VKAIQYSPIPLARFGGFVAGMEEKKEEGEEHKMERANMWKSLISCAIL